MVKVGDRIRVQGREARVTGRAAAGKHVQWQLDDGTTVLDLDAKVAAGQAEVLAAPAVAEPVAEEPRLTRRERRELERMPRENEDMEE